MAVRIRLTRRGRKKLAMFDVIVADARSPRDGRFIEKLGTYNPNTNPSSVELNEEKTFDWLMKGALPTETVKNILSDRGIMLKKHLQIGVLKGAITQEQADEKLSKWRSEKEAKLAKHIEGIAKTKSAKEKARLEAEAKVKEKRAEEIRKRQAELAPAVEEPAAADEETMAPESGEKLETAAPENVTPSSQPPASAEAAPESGEKPEALDDAEEK